MEPISSLGVWIRRRRKALDLTQPALADCVGCAVITIQKIEADERRPSEQMAERLVDCLAIPAHERTAFLQSTRAERAPDRLPTPLPPQPFLATQAPVAAPLAHNLPALATTLVGRTAEIAHLLEQLQQPTRLITLVGPGGVGKTTLALALAHMILDAESAPRPLPFAGTLWARHPQFPDGLWLAELAPLTDPTLVAQTIANPFGLPQQSTQAYEAALAAYLKTRRLLLLLDNCEHLVEACAALCEKLLRASPGLTILATSREPLNIAGESEWRVPPLQTPDLPLGRKSAPKAVEIGDAAAVQVFVSRAQLVQPSFRLDDQNALAITRICQRLDGLPLALELAAARLKSLSVQEISARLVSDLNARFALLASGRRTALPHQQTLRATLDWSYALLNDSERHLLQTLAVFAGGFTLAAAEAVSDERENTLNRLASLVDKSLVVARPAEEESTRYHLLETIRQYAWEKLVESGQAEPVQQRHLAWFMHWATEADRHCRGHEQALWLAHLDREQDNCRAALTFALDQARELGLALLMALWHFWSVRGYWGEQGEWLQRFQVNAENVPLTIQGIRALAFSAAYTRNRTERNHRFAAALTLAEKLGDQGGKVFVHYQQAQVLWWHNTAQAHHHFEQSLTLARSLGDPWEVAQILRAYGEFAYTRLEARATARRHMTESLEIFRQLRDHYGMADALVHLADVAFEQGDLAAVELYGSEGLALSRTLGFKYGILWGLTVLGGAAGGQGNFANAVEWLEECLTIARELGASDFIGVALFWLANTLRWQGDLPRAQTLFVEAMERGQQRNELNTLGSAQYGLAEIARARGDLAQATHHLTEALNAWRQLKYLWGIARVLATQAQLAALQEAPSDAVRLFAASVACQQQAAIGFTPLEQAEFDQTLVTLRTTLGESAFAAAWAEGQVMTLEEQQTR